jgi:hypothetical protein
MHARDENVDARVILAGQRCRLRRWHGLSSSAMSGRSECGYTEDPVVSVTDKIQFASAMLVPISAGVGFDTVFNRLQKEAEDVAIGPSRGK